MLTNTGVVQSASASGKSNITMSSLVNPKIYETFERKGLVLKALVREKISEALSGLPSTLHHMLKVQCILSGSSISSIYHNETINDFDLWFKEKTLIEGSKSYVLEQHAHSIMEYGETDAYAGLEPNNEKYNAKIITNNAITLKGKVQIITLGEYDQQRKYFDFVHCMPFYDIEKDIFYISPEQMECISEKKLKMNPGGRTPTEWRISKFLRRDWGWY
jgi:hypothetical protein